MSHEGFSERDQLQPLPKKRLYSVVLYNLTQMITVPIGRLFRRKPIVKGWTAKMEIGVKCFRYLLENDLKVSRDLEISVSKNANKALLKKIKIMEFKTSDFFGYWVGGVPEKGVDPILLYIHGGGFCLCTAMTYLSGLNEIMIEVTKHTNRNILIFALEYNRAPEAKFPSQTKEVVAAYHYLRKTYPERKLIILGESAGGNLVLSMLLYLKQEYQSTTHSDGNGCQFPDIAIAISPWVELVTKLDNEYRKRDRESDFITSLQLVHFARNYLPDSIHDVINPLASPISGEFGNTCPIMIHYGAEEFFTPEIDQFVERLSQQQDATITVIKEDMAPHITPLLQSWFGSIAEKGINAISGFIISHVYQNTLQ